MNSERRRRHRGIILASFGARPTWSALQAATFAARALGGWLRQLFVVWFGVNGEHWTCPRRVFLMHANRFGTYFMYSRLVRPKLFLAETRGVWLFKSEMSSVNH